MSSTDVPPSAKSGPGDQVILWRMMFAIFLTGTSVFLHILNDGAAAAAGLGITLGVLYLSIGLAYFSARTVVSGNRVLATQFGIDTICTALIIKFCGGANTILPLLFCVPIVLSAIYLKPRHAVFMAGLASICTGALAFSPNFRPLTELDNPARNVPLLVGSIHVVTFLVVGIVSANLAGRFVRRNRLQDRAENQIQRARTEVRNIVDNLHSGLIAVDRDGIIKRVNAAAGTILDIDEEAVLGNPFRTALGSGRTELADRILEVARGGEPLIRNEVTVLQSGRELPLGLSVSHLEGADGAISGAIAVFSDLSEVKRMQERIRKADRLAGVGELAASIAHEIRNPLASIRGSVEILASDLELEGHQADLLELILKESARVNTIITDFLSFARLRPASPQRIHCRDFIADVALQIRQHISVHGNGVNLTYWVVPDDMEITVDPEQMVQLFLNLAINACEAMAYKGELLVAAELTEDGQTCELKVVDNGPGIDVDSHEDLFTPFVTTKKNGTGLGLPMVARIAQAHGGSVDVGPAPSGGAFFSVRLPVNPPKTEPDTVSTDEVWSLDAESETQDVENTVSVP